MMTSAEDEDRRQALFQASQAGRKQRQAGAYNPFSYYTQMGMQQQTTPDMRRQQLAQQFQQKIMGQTPTTAAGGMAQLAAGLGSAIGNYSQQGQQFPTAPGGATPSFGTTLGNFFTGRNNRGLY